MSEHLDEAGLGDDPVAAAQRWLAEARDAGPAFPEAMALATVGDGGVPAVRYVLCRGLDDDGVVFFTNYASDKAGDLDSAGQAAVVFHWEQPRHRQLRINGPVTRVEPDMSAAYFATRSRGSRISAWASPQSRPIADRAALDELWHRTDERFDGLEVPLPPHWGGYRIGWDVVEFWQSRSNRLHDRIRFRRRGDGWDRERLGP